MGTYYEKLKSGECTHEDFKEWTRITINPIKKFSVVCDMKFDVENGVCIISTKDTVSSIVGDYFDLHTRPAAVHIYFSPNIEKEDFINNYKKGESPYNCQFLARSFCNKKEDTFDYDTGYKVAEEKMKKMIRKEIVHVYKNLIAKNDKINSKLLEDVAKLSEKE